MLTHFHDGKPAPLRVVNNTIMLPLQEVQQTQVMFNHMNSTEAGHVALFEAILDVRDVMVGHPWLLVHTAPFWPIAPTRPGPIFVPYELRAKVVGGFWQSQEKSQELGARCISTFLSRFCV